MSEVNVQESCPPHMQLAQSSIITSEVRNKKSAAFHPPHTSGHLLYSEDYLGIAPCLRQPRLEETAEILLSMRISGWHNAMLTSIQSTDHFREVLVTTSFHQ